MSKLPDPKRGKARRDVQRSIQRLNALRRAVRREATAKAAIAFGLETARLSYVPAANPWNTPVHPARLANLHGWAREHAERKALGLPPAPILYARQARMAAVRQVKQALRIGICTHVVGPTTHLPDRPVRRCKCFVVRGTDLCHWHLKMKKPLLAHQHRVWLVARGKKPLVSPGRGRHAVVWGLAAALKSDDLPLVLRQQPAFIATANEVFRLRDLKDPTLADQIRTLGIIALEMIACWQGDALTDEAKVSRANRWATLAAAARHHGVRF